MSRFHEIFVDFVRRYCYNEKNGDREEMDRRSSGEKRSPGIVAKVRRFGMKRVLLKLSGEALAGEKKTGFDEPTVMKVAMQVKTLVDQGMEVGIVIGGGNFWRGRSSENIDRTKADQIGMLATVMNCIYVSEIFRAAGMKTAVMTPFACGAFTELFPPTV